MQVESKTKLKKTPAFPPITKFSLKKLALKTQPNSQHTEWTTRRTRNPPCSAPRYEPEFRDGYITA